MGLFKTADFREECEKSASILKSFVDKGKILPDIISNAKGLAIFTGFRAGMYFAGAGGSGVVIARLTDGTWSSPSAFAVRSGSVGLVYGVDVYDCVCVLNTKEAVDAYKKSEVNLGGAVALAAGPLGVNVNVGEVKPVWTYTKSRGVYGGLTVDGTVIREKRDVNTEFYGAELSSAQILDGQAHGGWSSRIYKLLEVVKAAEGKSADKSILQSVGTEPTPGDLTE
ncbi:YSC84-like protein [Fusarium heterosporum]|uniref:YSC84-like protein n=1 Tax=Fusarium heterosporum TaxID=42747 RepID=A0A8H5STN4_FUSHE|nr:YSC84-like protein [Fusarium heterosporum]